MSSKEHKRKRKPKRRQNLPSEKVAAHELKMIKSAIERAKERKTTYIT